MINTAAQRPVRVLEGGRREQRRGGGTASSVVHDLSQLNGILSATDCLRGPPSLPLHPPLPQASVPFAIHDAVTWQRCTQCSSASASLRSGSSTSSIRTVTCDVIQSKRENINTAALVTIAQCNTLVARCSRQLIGLADWVFCHTGTLTL